MSGTTFDSNIITEFLQTRTDPTTKGSSRPSFSCFVAVSDLTYGTGGSRYRQSRQPESEAGHEPDLCGHDDEFRSVGRARRRDQQQHPRRDHVSQLFPVFAERRLLQHPMQFGAGTATCKVGSMDKFGLEFMLVTVKVTASPGTVLSDKATITSFNPDPDRVPDRSWTMKTLVTRYESSYSEE